MAKDNHPGYSHPLSGGGSTRALSEMSVIMDNPPVLYPGGTLPLLAHEGVGRDFALATFVGLPPSLRQPLESPAASPIW